jgi:hypothetical protein
VFLVNSRLALFTATPSGFDTLAGHPFSRSYGVILPSSFTRVLPSACGYSPRPPVSVYGTGALATGLEDFLGSGVSARLWPEGLPIVFQGSAPTDLPIGAPYALGPALPIAGGA